MHVPIQRSLPGFKAHIIRFSQVATRSDHRSLRCVWQSLFPDLITCKPTPSRSHQPPSPPSNRGSFDLLSRQRFGTNDEATLAPSPLHIGTGLLFDTSPSCSSLVQPRDVQVWSQSHLLITYASHLASFQTTHVFAQHDIKLAALARGSCGARPAFSRLPKSTDGCPREDRSGTYLSSPSVFLDPFFSITSLTSCPPSFPLCGFASPSTASRHRKPDS